MKKITKYLMAAGLLLAIGGMVACTEKDNNPTTPTEQPGQNPNPDPGPNNDTIRNIVNVGTHYAFYLIEHNNGETTTTLIEAGDTLTHTAPDAELNDFDLVELQFKIENKQRETLLTNQELKMLEGTPGMEASINPSATQGATVCGNGSCPWNGQPYSIPGGMYEHPIGIQLTPSHQTAGSWALYRLAVGVGDNFENATVIYIRVNL